MTMILPRFLHWLKSSHRSLARNTLFSGVTSIMYFLTGTVMLILTARVLGVAEFGTITLAITTSTVIALLPNYGFDLFIIRELVQNRLARHQVVGNVFAFKLLLSLLAIGVLHVYISNSAAVSEPTVFWIFGISALLLSFTTFLNAILKADEQFSAEAVTVTVQTAVQIVPVLTLALLSALTAVALAWIVLIGRTFGLMTALWFLWRDTRGKTKADMPFRVEPAVMSRLARQALPFALQSALGMLYFQSDTLIIGELVDVTSVGYYQAGMRLVVAFMRVPAILMSAFYPRIAFDLGEDGSGTNLSSSRMLIHLLLFVGGFLTLFFGGLARPIILGLYGAKMAASIPLLRVLGLIFVVRFVASGYGLIIVSSRHQEIQLLGAAIAVAVNIGLNLLLVPQYGFLAAAWVNLATNVMILALYALFLRYELHTLLLSEVGTSFRTLLQKLPRLNIRWRSIGRAVPEAGDSE